MGNMFKKLGAEAILLAVLSPLIGWGISFISMSYGVKAQVENQKEDLKQIKEDVRYIKNYLLEKK